MILRSHRPQIPSAPTLRWYRYLAIGVSSVLAAALVTEARAQSADPSTDQSADEMVALETLAATVGMSVEETAAVLQQLASSPVDESTNQSLDAALSHSEKQPSNLTTLSLSVPDIGLQISDPE